MKKIWRIVRSVHATRCPVLLCMSFHSTLARFFWNFITGLSISPLRLLLDNAISIARSLQQISRQPSQPEGTKYPKLNSWICPNSLVALLIYNPS